MTSFSLISVQNQKFATFPFVKNNLPLENAPQCGLTLRAAGSMRFRWAETNELRNQTLQQIAGPREPVPVQLDHTHIVYDIKTAADTSQKIGDGIITVNKSLMPVVTVADCVPIYLYDSVTGVFGIVHSGWKGTGIAVDAINLACKNYGSKVEDFSVVIGPHIHDCCYIVDQNRADYFAENFTPECICPLEPGVKVDWNNGDGPLFRLSLLKANLAALKKAGVPDSNIAYCEDCTSCNSMYGSNRRETKENGRPDAFTVQAAFVRF